MTNNVSSFETAINNNFAAVKAALNNLGSGGSVYSATNPSAITPVNGVASWTINHNLNTTNIRADLYFIANTTVAKNSHKTIIMGM